MQLDPTLIDEMMWPSDAARQEDVCTAVATYGPGGGNATRALILRQAAASWEQVGRVSLHSLAKQHPDLMCASLPYFGCHVGATWVLMSTA